MFSTRLSIYLGSERSLPTWHPCVCLWIQREMAGGSRALE